MTNDSGHWMSHSRIASMMDRLFPEGYWPRGMDESARAASVRTFEADIYPLWAPIEKRDMEREASMEMKQVNAPGQVLFECETMHRQDLAIHRSGIKPNRANVDQEKMADLRRKDARSRSM